MKMLVKQENTSIFSMKSIQVMIKFFWDDHYQPTIQNFVFLPFVAYLLVLVTMNIYVGTTFDYSYGTDSTHSAVVFQTKLVICFILQVYLTSIEIMQAQDFGLKEFFDDTHNIFDLACYSINFAVQIMFWNDFLQGNAILVGSIQKFVYAISCLILWFKLYYLMRIFTDYAHFITTIHEVLKEIKVFIVITGLVIVAFANLFHVLGDSDHGKGRYVSNYLGE